MKRKLSLLLAMVLAMTMVMGIGVTSFADARIVDFNNTDVIDFGFIPSQQDEVYIYEFVNAGPHYYEAYADDVLVDGPSSVEYGSYYNLADAEFDGYVSGYFTSGTSLKHGCRFVWDGANKVAKEYYYSLEYYEEKYSTKPIENNSPAHTHNFQWQTITEPTKDADGLEGEMCSCGATRNTQPLSAYVYALNEYATPMINAAKAGQTITFEFGEWNSFPKSFMAKLVDKSAQNVTFVFKYKWNHKLQTITIPAGTPIDLNFDWYGPAKMAELYGAN